MNSFEVAAAVRSLVALAAHTQGAAPTELARATGLDCEVVSAILAILDEINLIETDPQFVGRFRLGAAADRLGEAGRFVTWRKLALPYLKQLSELTGRRASLHVLESNLQRAIRRISSPVAGGASIAAPSELSRRTNFTLRERCPGNRCCFTTRHNCDEYIARIRLHRRPLRHVGIAGETCARTPARTQGARRCCKWPEVENAKRP